MKPSRDNRKLTPSL